VSCYLAKGAWAYIALETVVPFSVTAARSLQSSLQSCRGFMPLATRLLVDSIAAACLQAMVSHHQSHVAALPLVKASFLRLGCTCLSTPCPTGASSSILEQLRDSANACRLHSTDVSAIAEATLRLCDSIATPRVPALHIDTQRHDLAAEATAVSAFSLAKDIQNAAEVMAHAEKTPSQEHSTKRRKLQKNTFPTGDGDDATSVNHLAGTHTESEDKHPAQSQTQHYPEEIIEPEKPLENEIIQQIIDHPVITEGIVEEKEEGDDFFLPSIIDDEGPDEEDV